MAITACALAAAAAENNTVVRENFESGSDPFRIWRPNGEYQIHSKGLTAEKAAPGKKCFKADVTFLKDGSFLYLSLPLENIPAEGKLNFSGRIMVKKQSGNGKASLGLSFSFAPCLPFYEFGKDLLPWHADTAGEWKLIEGDLQALGNKQAELAIPEIMWGVEAKNVGVSARRIVLYLAGDKDSRLEVYLADLAIEGKATAPADYAREIERRWAPAGKRAEEETKRWKEILAGFDKQISAAANPSAPESAALETLRQEMAHIGRRALDAEWLGFITKAHRLEMEAYFEHLRQELKRIKK